jgi:hypothetical protein
MAFGLKIDGPDQTKRSARGAFYKLGPRVVQLCEQAFFNLKVSFFLEYTVLQLCNTQDVC